MAILNYTTSIDASKTIGEIQAILAKHHVTRVVTEYEGGQPAALQFGFNHLGREYHFRLPCNFVGIRCALEKKRVESRYKTPEQVTRIGWRIVKDWVEAQMALIEAEIASPLEVFFPYALTAGNKTVFDHVLENESTQKLLM